MVADRGDTVYLMQGHNESLTLADAVDIDVDGVTIVGLGSGALAPTFDFDQVAGEFVVGADNVKILNLRLRASSPSVLLAIDIEDGSDYTSIIGCEFLAETPSTDFFINVIVNRNDSNNTLISGNSMVMGTTNAVSAILFEADSDNSTVSDNTIMGDYSTAVIEGDTTASEFLIIRDNTLWNGDVTGLNTEPVIELLTSSSGLIINNYMFCNVATVSAAVVGDAMLLCDNWYNEDAGTNVTGSPWHVGTFGGNLMNSVSPSGDG
jgi:hypothetical protein